MAAALCAPLLLLVLTGRVMPLTDMRGFHIPIRYLYQQALWSGDSLLWTPWIYSGTYLHGEGQAGFLHPAHLVIYRLLRLETAVSLEQTFNYVFATAGASILFRRLLRVHPAAALTGGAFFAFSGYNLMHAAHLNMVAVLAHLPWVVWLCDIVLVEPARSRRRAAALALVGVFGSQWLLGFPQAVYFTFLAIVPLAAIRAWQGARAAGFGWLAAALLFGAGLGAVQILPTLDVASHAYRASTGPAFALTYSLHALNVVQFWSPYTWPSRVFTFDEPPIPHEFAVYDGAFAMTALVWLALRFRQLTVPDRQRALLWSALGLLALILAFGRFAPLQRATVTIPGFSIFRAPARHIVLVHLALAALSALTLNDIINMHAKGERLAWARLAPLALVPLATIAGLWFTRHRGRAGWSVDGIVPIAQAIVALGWTGPTALVTALAGRGHRWAVPVLIVVSALDLGSYGYSFTLSDPSVTLRQLRTHATVPPGPPEGQTIWRPEEMPDGNLPIMLGWRMADGYLALSPKRAFDPHTRAAQRIVGATWALDGDVWSRVEDPMPPVRLLTRVVVGRNVAWQMQHIDVATTAVVQSDPGGLDGVAGAARLAAERPGRLTIETDAPGRQLLVTTTRFHEGWTARGCSSAPMAVYGELLGCVVPKGASRVEFTFAPRSFARGAKISLATSVVWIVCGAWLLRSRDARR